LEASLAENQSLNRRLITAQDDERRRTALDLHDEVGPSLFGLKAHAASMAKAAEALPEGAAAHMTERVRDLNAIIDHLQTINRGMLNRLRPMSLGQLPLADVLSELVSGRAREYPQIHFSCAAEGIERSYGEPIDLTLYRCIQEGLTNVIRHAEATSVDVGIAARKADRTEASVMLTVRDDGRGIDPLAPKGLGSLGMKERVEALAATTPSKRARPRHVLAGCDPAARKENDAGNTADAEDDHMSTVLIIDDHPIVLQAWRRMLQDAGVTDICDARDVASGYRLFRRRQPEFVIVDLSMQGRGLGGCPDQADLGRMTRARAFCVQHAQRPDDRGARARGRRQWLCAQGRIP
jgi:CheY-like chemotaxis protein